LPTRNKEPEKKIGLSGFSGGKRGGWGQKRRKRLFLLRERFRTPREADRKGNPGGGRGGCEDYCDQLEMGPG